jgi:L-malate glycosyltransferase
MSFRQQSKNRLPVKEESATSPRVVISTNYWKGSDGGGVKTYLLGLTDALKIEGINPIVVFREGNDLENYKLSGNSYFFIIKSLFAFRKIKPDVINAHGSWFCLFPSILWRQLNGTPLIYTIHTVADNPDLPERKAMKFLLKRCDTIVFGSRYLEEQTRRVYDVGIRESVIVCPGAINKTISGEEIRMFKIRLGIPEDRILLLGQGLTAHRVKIEGAKILILAVKKLKESYPNILLILTRESESVPILKEFTSDHDMSQYVIFTGDLDDPLVAVEACDILTHITLDDSIPISILEAMVFGKPIVASEVGGIPEIINNDNGQLVSNDPNDIARAIDHLLSDWDNAVRIGEAAKSSSIQHNWKKGAKIYKSLFLSK